MRYDLLIRESDKKCRAIDKAGKPLTGWMTDALKVDAAMRRKFAVLSSEVSDEG